MPLVRSKLFVFVVAVFAWTFVPGFSGEAHAQETVEIAPSTLTPQAGQPFTMTITSVDKSASVPPEFGIDGLKVLDIRTGRQTSAQLTNDGFRSKTTYSYTYILVAEKEGKLILPPFDFEVGGVTYESEEIEFEVQKKPPANPKDDPDKNAFIEILPGVKDPFVGQLVPVDVKVYVDQRIQITNFNQDAVVVKGEGFTFNGGGKAKQSRENRFGRTYNVYTFNVGITPLKPGELKTDPLDVSVRYTAPRSRRNRHDPFAGFPSLFNQQNGEVKAASIELNVRPLPSENRPDSFSGAVGKFRMNVKTDLDAIEGSNPLTLETTISGRGNFSRVRDLGTFNSDVWKSYPDNEGTFTKRDEIGLLGVKTFQHEFIPLDNTEKSPGIVFSFFDPEKEEYETLRMGPFDVRVTGVEKLPEPVQATEPDDESREITDILPIIPHALDSEYRGTRPAWRNALFWVGNGLAGSTCAVFLVFVLLGKSGKAKEREMRRRLDHERSRIWSELRQHDLGAAEFGELGMRFIGICHALQSGPPGSSGVSPTPVEVVQSIDDSKSYAEDLRAFVDHANFAKFAPGGREDSLPELMRNRFLNALNKFSDDKS